MKEQDEGTRPREAADTNAEPASIRIGDHVVSGEDAERLDRLEEAFESVVSDREADAEALVDDDADDTDDNESEERDGAENLEQDSSIDASVEPVGRVGNVQFVIDGPRPKGGDAAPDAKLSHKAKSTMHIGSGKETYNQEVSDDARAEGLGWMSVGNIPASRDDGRGAVGAFEAASKRHEARSDEEKAAKGFVICEVDTDLGQRSRQILEHAKEKSPDIYNNSGFKVVVTARSQDRLDQLRDSGAFAEHEGKVDFQLVDPEKLRVPDGTLLALAPDVNLMPTTRLYRTPQDIPDQSGEGVLVPAGGIAAATERTVIRGESPVVTPDAEDGDLPRAHWPQAFDKFYTAESDEARAKFEPALRSRVGVEFKPDSPENVEEGWRDRDIERFMDGCPPGTTIKSWQPEVVDTVATLSRQSELVYVDGLFRSGNEKLAWPQMSRREGQLWRHTTHTELVTEGAEKVGARAYVPPRGNGKFNHILIDHSADDEARAAAREAFDDVISAEGADTTSRLVGGAEKRLEDERQRLSEEQEGGGNSEAVPAVDAIERAYNRYVQTRPEGKVDHELALSLAQRLYSYGHYEDAIRFADRAIFAAPQMAANAHNLRAQALIMGQRFDEAGQAIDAAIAISPQDPKLYRTQAAIALRQGDDGAYAEARIDEQRYATYRLEDAPKKLSVGWSAVSRAMVRESEAALEDDATEPVAVLYTRHNPDTNEVVAGTAMVPRPIARAAVLRNGAIEMAVASAQSIEQAYVSEGPQAQGEAVDRFGNIIDRAAWRRDPDDPDSEVIPPHELAPVNLQLIGEAAMQAAEHAPGTELERAADRRPTTSFSPPSAVRERSPYAAEDIAVGHKINERGDAGEPFTIPLKMFNKPVIVEGATGTGKTTTVSNIALKLGVEGIPWLMIDAGPSPSYGGLPERAAQLGVKVYYWDPTKDDVGMPTLDIMTPIRGSSPQNHLESLMPWVQTISNGGEPLPQLVGEAAYSVYAGAGYDVYTERGYPNLHVLANPVAPGVHEFADNVVTKAVESGYSRAAGDVKAFAERRVLEIKRMERMLGNARPIDWDWLFENNVVVDLSNMTPPMKQSYAAGLQTMYGEYLKTRFGGFGGANIGLQHVTFVEEGHHLYGIPQSEEAAAQQEAARMWAERTTAYRKLGEGTVIVTQAPNQIISQVMENTDLVIAHRTPAIATRRPVADTMGIDEDSRDYTRLRELQDGQALVTQTGQERQLVRMAEPDDLSRERDPVEVDTATSRPPATAIRGGRRPSGGGEPYSNDELKEAYREARSPQRASWVVWGTQLALAEMTGEKLGAPPKAMQRQWEEMDPRKRESLLDEINEIVVGERQEVLREYFSPAELKTVLKTTQTGMLNGQPLAGRRPGTKFLVPPLVGVHVYEQLKQPFGAPTPNPRGRAWPIKVPLPGVNVQTGHPDDGRAATPRTVREQIKMLERSPVSTVGSDKEHAQNRKVAWVALLGANGGRTFFEALGHFARGRKDSGDAAELYARVRHAEVAMGLIGEGDPRSGPLAQYISLANRFLKKAA